MPLRAVIRCLANNPLLASYLRLPLSVILRVLIDANKRENVLLNIAGRRVSGPGRRWKTHFYRMARP